MSQQPIDNTDNKRVYWHSRRGMLEIDLALMPFAENVYPQLAEEEKQLYKKFLEQEDADIFAWLMGHKTPDDKDLETVLAMIKEYQLTPR